MIKIGPVDTSKMQRGLEERFARAQAASLKLAETLGKRAVQNNFRRTEDETGTQWPRLRYRSGTPLNRSGGHMMKGISSRVDGSVVWIGAGDRSAAYNAVHNFGSRLWKSGAKWGKRSRFQGQPKGIPRRHFMYLRKEDQSDVRRQVRELFMRRYR